MEITDLSLKQIGFKEINSTVFKINIEEDVDVVIEEDFHTYMVIKGERTPGRKSKSLTDLRILVDNLKAECIKQSNNKQS